MPTPHATDVQRLRRFGLTLAVGFAAVGAVSRWRGHDSAPIVVSALSMTSLLLALVTPARLAFVERRWLALGSVLGWINTRLILTIVFYGVVTPIGVIVRLFYDPLDRRVDERRTSYWIRRTPEPFDPKSYERQF